MRMFLIPLTAAAAIAAVVMVKRPGRLGGAKRKK
jgi:hypothetical protein